MLSNSRVRRTAHRPIREEDLVLLRDRYVALDDALCLVRLTSLLDRYRKPYRIRAERSTSFADLRDTPSVLIGAFDNPWTLRTADQLRFTFRKDSENDIGMVHDSQHPENSEWKLTKYWPNWDVPVDYAIVTRMVDTTTDRPVIIAAGLTQYGTIGAGEFLSNPEYFSEAVRRLPGLGKEESADRPECSGGEPHLQIRGGPEFWRLTFGDLGLVTNSALNMTFTMRSAATSLSS